MENHKQVVSRIRASGEACVLLVADKDCDTWHRDHGSVIRSSLAYIVISSSRRNNEEEEDEEEEKLDLRLRKLSIEAEDEKDEDNAEGMRDSIDFSREESIPTLNRQESTTESRSGKTSPATDLTCTLRRLDRVNTSARLMVGPQQRQQGYKKETEL